jgi:pimeloyl-ACP methyl ester carboxylesterase
MTLPRRALAAAAAALVLASTGALALPDQQGRRGGAPPPPPSAERQAFEAWIDGQAMRALAERKARVAALRTAEDVRRYSDTARARITAMVGGMPDLTGPLNARVTRTVEREGYRMEFLLYESHPGLKVTAVAYVPNGNGPFPAVVGTAGHAIEGKASTTYQHAWISFARRGFLVLAFDPPGQGERIEYWDPGKRASRIGFGTREHSMTGQQLLLTGSHIAQFMAQDARRAIDYLGSRKDVDMTRVAVAGNSGGGTQAALLAAFEPRLAAIVSSCYMTSWEHMWQTPGPQDAEQVIPGFIGEGFDFADYAIAAAPRGFLVSSAVKDYFPIAGARQAYAELQRLYALVGQPDRVAMVENNAPHGWEQPLREGAYRWLGTWLKSPGPPAEAPLKPEPPASMNVTKTGQLATSDGTRTVRAIHADEARALASRRKPASAEALRTLAGLPATVPAPRIVTREPAAGSQGAETLVIEVEPGVRLRGRLYRPASGAAPAGAVLLVDDRGTAQAPQLAGLTEAGHTVLALDIRGTGDLGPGGGSGEYTSSYRLAARAWLLGTSVVAWQTRDILAGLAVLRQQAPKAELTLQARGQTAPAALFAAEFDRPAAIVLQDSLVSYLDLASGDEYQDASLMIMPRVLTVTDLPELMDRAAPARVTLRNPKTPQGEAITKDTLAARMGTAVPRNVEIVE